MNEVRERRRLPRSIRKHLRQEKARLKRLLAPEEARDAIDRLVLRFRRGAAPPIEVTARQDGNRISGTRQAPTREDTGTS
jgi:hypothetical protein